MITLDDVAGRLLLDQASVAIPNRGRVGIVSHDRHLHYACVNRLWLVASRRAQSGGELDLACRVRRALRRARPQPSPDLPLG